MDLRSSWLQPPRAARWMRRVPRFRRRAVVEAGAIVVAGHRGARAALGPVAAGHVGRVGKLRAVGLRAGEDVVHVRRIAAAVDHGALLGERGLLGQVVRAMQFGDVLRDDHALGIGPRAFADAVAGIDPARSLRAEVGAPRLAAGAGGLRQRLADLVGAIEPAEIGALAGPGAGDEEAHAALLRLRETAREQRCGGRRGDDADPLDFIHFGFSVVMVCRRRRPAAKPNTTAAPFHPRQGRILRTCSGGLGRAHCGSPSREIRGLVVADLADREVHRLRVRQVEARQPRPAASRSSPSASFRSPSRGASRRAAP